MSEVAAVVEEETEDTLRSELETAWDAAEEAGETGHEEVGGSDEDTEESVRTTEEGQGGQADPEKGEAADDAPDKPDEGGDQPAAAESAPAEEAPSSPESRAPDNWSPALREQWGNVPKEVQSFIHEREKQFQRGIQQYAEGAKYGGEMDEAIAPFRQIMRMEGASDVEAVKSLCGMAATMRMGTPAQKAGIIQKLIGDYGVDIQVLDNMLVGEHQEDPVEARIAAEVERRMQPYQQHMSRIDQGRQVVAQRQQAEVDGQINEFATARDANGNLKYEFFGDLREEMADYIDFQAQRGRQVSLADAYVYTATHHPEISAIYRQRMQNEARGPSVPAKKAAAVLTPTGSDTPPQVADEDDSLRGSILNAWDQHSE